jgi:hypothetical protein
VTARTARSTVANVSMSPVQEWRNRYRPERDPQRVHDFEDKKLGKVVPYGVYDVAANTGFVSVFLPAGQVLLTSNKGCRNS